MRGIDKGKDGPFDDPPLNFHSHNNPSNPFESVKEYPLFGDLFAAPTRKRKMERDHARRSRSTTARNNNHNVDEEESSSTLPCRRISRESLSNIDEVKSMIAQMRPTRRRIKWNSAVSDWDRKAENGTTRIKVGIDMEELQLLGGVPLQQPEEKTAQDDENQQSSSINDLIYMEGDQVDELEVKINRSYDMIKIVTDENDNLDATAEELMAQNQALRQEIAGIPMGKKPTRKGLDQLMSTEKKLKKKVRELERQCKLLKQRQSEIEEAKKRLRSDEGMDETRSFATTTSKSISTFVEVDDDDEDIMVFSSGRVQEDSDDASSSTCVEEEVVDGEASLGGSLCEGEKEIVDSDASGAGSKLGDSLSELPYEPSIMNL